MLVENGKNGQQNLPNSEARPRFDLSIQLGDQPQSCGEQHFEQVDSSSFEECEFETISDSSSVSYQEEILEEHEDGLLLFLENHNQIFGNQFLIQKYDNRLTFNRLQIKLLPFRLALFEMLETVHNSKPDLVKYFSSYLKTQKTFERFLIHLYYRYDDQISDQLIKLSFLIWEQYRPFSQMALNNKELKSLSTMISNKLEGSKVVGQLMRSLKSSQEGDVLQGQFIAFFTETSVLVMQKCFQNPYLHQCQKVKNRKRKSIQIDQIYGEELGSTPCKKIKVETL